MEFIFILFPSLSLCHKCATLDRMLVISLPFFSPCLLNLIEKSNYYVKRALL